MLVTLEDIKDHLGIEPSDTTYDSFLTEQCNIVSEAMELYCRRRFLKATYTQNYYRDEISKDFVGELYAYHYPINSIVSFQDADGVDVTGYRLIKSTGLIRRPQDLFCGTDELVLQYSAGYTELPWVLKDVLYNLVGERYNKKVAGVGLSFGSDVQRVSIPGTISIDYDYTIENNDISRALGVIIGNQANVLDQFKSERATLGTVREGYVY